jgi:hypothetical protein
MSKHTPGPWFSHIDLKEPVITAQGAVYEPQVALVSEIDGETEANAYLIAAAPEMLEALHAVAQLAHNGGFPDMSADELRKLLFACGNRAMIAISKATGGDE